MPHTSHKHHKKDEHHAATVAENISPDILWEITKNYNSFQVKRRSGGGVLFTRDPLSLTNRQTRKHAGFISEKAIGIHPGKNGGVSVSTKNAGKSNKPSLNNHTSTYGSSTGSRKTYATVVNSTAKRGYRTDLRTAAIARTSAIKSSQRVKKDAPKPKLRGAKAKKAAEEA